MTRRRTTMDLGQVGHLRKGVFVPERNVDQSMVDKGGEGIGDGDLLSTTLGAGRDEDATHLSSKGGPAPEWACCVPECLMNPDETRTRPYGSAEDVPSTARGSYRSVWERRKGKHQS